MGEKRAELAVCDLQQDPGWAWDVVGDSARHQAAPQCPKAQTGASCCGGKLEHGASSGQWALWVPARAQRGACQTASQPRFADSARIVVVVGTHRACLPGACSMDAAWVQHGSGQQEVWGPGGLVAVERADWAIDDLARSEPDYDKQQHGAGSSQRDMLDASARTEDWLPGCCVNFRQVS